mmetsp:Transcript_21304/g.66787  ORF Transcript_21304/g.66787 Transcript_21304/m.66787 type:complete len:81 (+) Transcript_21304:1442-1684(+)
MTYPTSETAAHRPTCLSRTSPPPPSSPRPAPPPLGLGRGLADSEEEPEYLRPLSSGPTTFALFSLALLAPRVRLPVCAPL